jgi:hypothetical protein
MNSYQIAIKMRLLLLSEDSAELMASAEHPTPTIFSLVMNTVTPDIAYHAKSVHVFVCGSKGGMAPISHHLLAVVW